MWIIKILAGLLGGIAGGMGMGGGTLTIPILTIFLSVNQICAQGINLIAFIPMAIIALMIHFKNGLVDFKNVWPMSVVGCCFSLLGSLIANHLSSVLLKKMFAVFLIGLAIWQIFDIFKNRKNSV